MLTLLTGDIGFQGDDWWVLSFPYWNPFPQSVLIYAKAALRPVEGLYWICLFELFGFNRFPYLFASLTLNVLSSTLFAVSLYRAFSDKPQLAVWGALFSFFMPMNSSLVFIMHTDNSRLAMIFFWACVVALQRAIHGSPSLLGLSLICYLLSVLTYENASMLIFAMPFLAASYANTNRPPLMKRFLLNKILLFIAVGFLGFLAIRFLLLSGGAVSHAGVFPSLKLLVSYFRGVVDYLFAPWRDISFDAWSLIFGAAIGVAVHAFLKEKSHAAFSSANTIASHNRSMLFVIGLGGVVFLLGVIPYVLAGYTADIGFTGQSRIYSAGGFGVAMMLGAMFSLHCSAKLLRRLMNLTGVLLLAWLAAFQCEFRKDWQHAAEIRKDLCQSLLTIVPNVTDSTTLLFLDLQSYIGKRAVIYQGVDGLDEYVKMLYNNKSLHGYFLYSRQSESPNNSERTAIVTPQGIIARGSLPYGPSPLDAILILRSYGRSFSLVKSLSHEDSFLDAQWVGVYRIASQADRIVETKPESRRKQRCLY